MGCRIGQTKTASLLYVVLVGPRCELCVIINNPHISPCLYTVSRRRDLSYRWVTELLPAAVVYSSCLFSIPIYNNYVVTTTTTTASLPVAHSSCIMPPDACSHPGAIVLTMDRSGPSIYLPLTVREAVSNHNKSITPRTFRSNAPPTVEFRFLISRRN